MPRKKKETYIYVDVDGTESTISGDPTKEQGLYYYDGKYYAEGHNDIIICRHCDRRIHRNLLLDHWCAKCWHEEGHTDVLYCMECKHLHSTHMPCNILKNIDEVEGEVVKFGKRVDVNTENHNFCSKGDCKENEDLIKSIGQYQSERDLPVKIKEQLENFYCNSIKFNHYYYWGDYKIEGDITYMNTRKLNDILYKHKENNYDIVAQIKKGYKTTPYRNYYLVGITEDGLLERAKYDLMGKEKHWTEKPNTFLQNIGYEINNEDNSMQLHYVLSSDLEHKMLAFNSNGRFGSCQKKENNQSYAAGAYDAVTNGCNLPILIYRYGANKPMGRITCRVMYDKQGKEYLLLERLYHDGTLGDNSVRGKMYAKIAYDLKCKGYNVIASNYSAHDSSTYSYLAKFGLSSNTIVKDLVQPLRQLPNGYGYYCDGGTNVYHGDVDGIDWATDYLDKAYLI